MIIQIYAFTLINDAISAAELGVDHIGFVAGRYGIVHGELDYSEASNMADAIRDKAKSVALTMSTDIDEIMRMVDIVKPDILHISTEPEAVGVQDMERLHDRLSPNIRIMKAIPVGNASSIEIAKKYAPFSDLILLDSQVQGFPGVGATGYTHDWHISRQIVESISIPVILAGGLNAENVAQSIETVKPWGVDSNTCTNIRGDPVAKDLKLVAAFVTAVKKTTSDQ